MFDWTTYTRHAMCGRYDWLCEPCPQGDLGSPFTLDRIKQILQIFRTATDSEIEEVLTFTCCVHDRSGKSASTTDITSCIARLSQAAKDSSYLLEAASIAIFALKMTPGLPTNVTGALSTAQSIVETLRVARDTPGDLRGTDFSELCDAEKDASRVLASVPGVASLWASLMEDTEVGKSLRSCCEVVAPKLLPPGPTTGTVPQIRGTPLGMAPPALSDAAIAMVSSEGTSGPQLQKSSQAPAQPAQAAQDDGFNAGDYVAAAATGASYGAVLGPKGAAIGAGVAVAAQAISDLWP